MRCFNTTTIGVGLAGLSQACAEPAPEALTYHRDIAPILASHCVDCHRAGGIAPFPLTSHDEVMPYAEAIATATAARMMPPQNLDNSGDCNTFVDARWLDEDEIATIMAWVQAGAPAGSATDEPPNSPPEWQLDRSDLTLMMPEPYTPSALEEDEYRCFILDPGLGEDAFVTGFAARLGQPAMVHHMTLFALDSAEAEEEAAALDAAEHGPGYTCFADPGVLSRWLVSSGPGDPGGLLPAGTGLPMGAGRKTVLQMHYNRVNGTFPDQTAIDLKLEPGVTNEAFVESVADTRFELPPGEAMVVTGDSMTLDADFTLWGVWPHMHNLGTRLRVTAIRPGRETCLARVDQYEFHWQRFAFYERPIHVHAGDTLQISCTYDTRGRDAPTGWGLKTADEMCIAFFYITEGLQGRGALE